MRGAALYASDAVGCGNCHGAEPADMIQGIQKGTTAAALAASYRSVRSMNRYQTLLTAANNDDLAAFIRSRLTP
jgi:mono/diheme cytochrome c family protein